MVEQNILLSEKSSFPGHATPRGRPQSQLLLNPNVGHIVTLIIRIDLLRVQRIDYAGRVCATWEQEGDTREMNRSQLLRAANQAVTRVCPKKIRTSLHHIGVAFQGVTEHTTGNLVWSPIIGDRDVPIGASLKKKFGVSVSVNNDNHLVSQALSQQHADVLGDTFAGIIFSYGVGLGLYLDGMPFAGSRSSALEFGHLGFELDGAICRCGNRGCIEAYAADYGVARMAQKGSIDQVPMGRVTEADFEQLSVKALAGDRAALQAFKTAGVAIGEGLATLFTLLDTMQVAMIGRTFQEFELMRDGIESGFHRRWYRKSSISELLHCFEDDRPLVDYGLAQNSLREVDKQLASFPANASVGD